MAKAGSVGAGYPLYSPVWSDHPPLHTLLLHRLAYWTGAPEFLARVLACLFSALLLGSLIQFVSRGGTAAVAIMVAGLFLACGQFLPLAPAALIIVPAYALALLSVLVFIAALERPARSLMLLSGVCLGLGLMTKFTAVLVLPLIVLLGSPAGLWLLGEPSVELACLKSRVAWQMAGGRCGW